MKQDLVPHSLALIFLQPILNISVLQKLVFGQLVLIEILIQRLMLHHCHMLSNVLQHLKHEDGSQVPTLFDNIWL